MPSQLEILREALAKLEAKMRASLRAQIAMHERTEAHRRGEWPYGENPFANKVSSPAAVGSANKS